jgi:hypothetical protein
MLKFWKLSQKPVVDPGRVRFEHLQPTRRYFEMNTPGTFDQASLIKVSLRPMNPVAEERLLPGRE